VNLVRPIVFAMVAAISIGGFQRLAHAGDLHKKTMRDWKLATKQNRLETIIDLVSARESDKLTILVQSAYLVGCINEAGANSNDQSVVDFTTICLILMEIGD
jgi:hypothetical protein